MPVTNLNQFNAKLDAFAQRVPHQLTIVQRKIALTILEQVIKKNPVDTGRSRGNWQVSINALPTGEVQVGLVDTGKEPLTDPPAISLTGQDALSQGIAVLAEIEPFSVVYIANNVNYIVYLEEGSSQQAPEGMVNITLNDLLGMFADIES